MIKLLAAIILNLVSGRVAFTPLGDYADTVIMDMECDLDPDCDFAVRNPVR